LKLRSADPGADETTPEAPSPHEVAGDNASSTLAALLEKLMEGSSAEIAWLLRSGRILAVAHRGGEDDLVSRCRLVDLPRPPLGPMLVDVADGTDAWARWCAERGLHSCAVAPVVSAQDRIGAIVLASRQAEVLDPRDLPHLEMAAWLAARGWESDERVDALRRQFADVYPLLRRALPLDRAMKAPPGFQSLARAIGGSLDATYCRIASSTPDGRLVIEASAGHRPPEPESRAGISLDDLPGCREALRGGRPMVLTFDQAESGSSAELRQVFTPQTKTGIVLPFSAGPGIHGLLLVGEERLTRAPQPYQHRREALQLVADRLGEILRISDLLGRQRAEEMRRHTRMVEQTERRRLARELHDVVGQALSAVLMQVRAGMEQEQIDPADLRELESATQGALDAARALAYDLRGLEEGVDPIGEARSYAEITLGPSGYRLDWQDQRVDKSLPPGTAYEVAMVIREAITNVVRHSRGDRVKVRLTLRRERVRVTIRDNGVGFSAGQLVLTRDRRGLGLLGSAERLHGLGGLFEVTALRTGGTLVTAEAPVAAPVLELPRVSESAS
jgi:signal transduction histidine kinase